MKILAGNSNFSRFNCNLSTGWRKAVRRFADNEVFVEILGNAGEDVFLIQSTSYPANDHLMELLIMIDALRRASARRITRHPLFYYARQDRKPVRTPISAGGGKSRRSTVPTEC